MHVGRIGLLGGESTGKSTLSNALCRSLPACGVDEVLRTFVEEQGRTPTRAEQPGLLDRQRRAEDAVAAACDRGVLVADPAVLMTAVYSELYFDDPSLTAAAVDLTVQRYDLVVWCGTDLPWSTDAGQRDGEQFRAAADRLIARLVSESLRPRGMQVIRVTGPLADRVEAVTQAWQSISETGPT